MFLTRLGFGSKMVITGDITQVDLPDGRKSGLKEIMRILRDIEDIAQVRFDGRDVVRHRLVQDIIKAVSYTHLDVYKRQRWGMPGGKRTYFPCTAVSAPFAPASAGVLK